jgi:hypothetical protein
MVFESGPVHLVGAAFDGHVDGGAAGQPLLGVEAAGNNVHLLDRLERRDVGDDMRQLHGGGTHAVDARIVLVVARAVDVELEGA